MALMSALNVEICIRCKMHNISIETAVHMRCTGNQRKRCNHVSQFYRDAESRQHKCSGGLFSHLLSPTVTEDSSRITSSSHNYLQVAGPCTSYQEEMLLYQIQQQDLFRERSKLIGLACFLKILCTQILPPPPSSPLNVIQK